MNSLQTNNAPNSSVVVPHFIFGAINLFVLAILILLANANLFEAYFNTKLIAITHMAVLGWATMIVFGALYQLIPVVFETSLYSEKLAKFTFWISAVSIIFLTYSFWIGAFSTLLIYAALLMFFSLLLFVVNVLLSYKKSAIKNTSSKFIIAAILWLAVTELIGTIIALNFKFGFLTVIHLHYLKIHATVGLIGWFLMLIIGVGSTLLPMFLISHNLKYKKLDISFILLNMGLIGLISNWFLVQNVLFTVVCWVLIVVGVLLFISFIYESYKKRIRKKLDVGMQYSMLAIASIFLPIIISLVVLVGFNLKFEILSRVIVLYGFSIIFGFITTLILGQTYKTLPFIIWLEKYKSLVGKVKTPLPRELYSKQIATIQFYLYLFFLVTIPIGFLMNNNGIIKIGSYSLLAVSILYNINVLKIIFHKVKNNENE
ncbi:hypothetical protein Lupro_05230 [Lutibacter profundi]|uniref:Cytochrome C oxidase subunit I n=1 Tax=Lutibacter profundi TaxID=1622118 RepID=A0A0X8G5X5_9FLAO|nr:hypothetical protein [Lutibacter profundi]AMC10681.1 hypothetical protein Lupro_05230 [Lutibacter profundi]